jgi:hypothetical protein
VAVLEYTLSTMIEISIALSALYLRGAPREGSLAKSRAWTVVAELLRRAPQLSAASEALRDAGLWSEALVLDTPGLLEWAEQQTLHGRTLTANEPSYPARWFDVLGSAAPVALWRCGEVPEGPSLAIVGSRDPSVAVSRFCTACAQVAVASGYRVVSGGAVGCDRAARRGAGASLIEIIPFGLSYASTGAPGCLLSVCAPGEPFSRATAMERNQLIYASSSVSLIGAARLGEGGTWHGAIDALRRRLTSLLMRDDGTPAAEALFALGAGRLAGAASLISAISELIDRHSLFRSVS